MSEQTAHTPTPWRYREWEGLPVIDFPDTRMAVGNKEQAAYFKQAVAAVNAHAQLVEALRRVRAEAEEYRTAEQALEMIESIVANALRAAEEEPQS